MTSKNFEDFLKDQHAENYHGTDDNMPDSFDDYVSNLDVEQVLDLADEYGAQKELEGFERARKIALDAITYKPQ